MYNNETDQEELPGVMHKSIFTVLWIVALLLNATSTILLCKETRKRSSWANVLILSIALTDICALMFVVLPAIVAMFVHNIFQDIYGLCCFQGVSLNMFILISFCLVIYVSLDQYMAICHPFMYSTKVSRYPNRSLKLIITILLTMLFITAVISTLPTVTGADYGPLSPPLFCYYNLHANLPQNISFSSINAAIMVSLSLVLLYFTICIGTKLNKLHHELGKYASSHVAGPERSKNRQQITLAKLSVVTAIVFLACTLPFEVNHAYINNYTYKYTVESLYSEHPWIKYKCPDSSFQGLNL